MSFMNEMKRYKILDDWKDELQKSFKFCQLIVVTVLMNIALNCILNACQNFNPILKFYRIYKIYRFRYMDESEQNGLNI